MTAEERAEKAYNDYCNEAVAVTDVRLLRARFLAIMAAQIESALVAARQEARRATIEEITILISDVGRMIAAQILLADSDETRAKAEAVCNALAEIGDSIGSLPPPGSGGTHD